ncbi:MAG: profilin family protein [Promethearchaeota archaeon]
MPIDPQTAVYNLMQNDPHMIAAAVLKGKEIVYSTDNWDISADIGRVISSWIGQSAQFIMMSGVKYSVLQCEPERLIATNLRGEGSIVCAKDEEFKIIVYLEPDGYAPGAAMDVQRALGTMSTKGVYIAEDTQLGQKTQTMGGVDSADVNTVSVDPQLKGEIQAFLDWIKDAEGLAGYISYYLQQNNTQIIAELSKIYQELRTIFGV